MSFKLLDTSFYDIDRDVNFISMHNIITNSRTNVNHFSIISWYTIKQVLVFSKENV